MGKMLGDMTEDALKAIGGDKIAKFYERTTGRGCNCANRRQMLNNLHRAAQRALERAQQPVKQRNLRPPVVKTEPQVHKPPTKPVDER